VAVSVFFLLSHQENEITSQRGYSGSRSERGLTPSGGINSRRRDNYRERLYPSWACCCRWSMIVVARVVCLLFEFGGLMPC